MADDTGPIIAPQGGSPALASRPETVLDERYHIYEPNPAPWWLAVLWIGFLFFGAGYLVLALMR